MHEILGELVLELQPGEIAPVERLVARVAEHRIERSGRQMFRAVDPAAFEAEVPPRQAAEHRVFRFTVGVPRDAVAPGTGVFAVEQLAFAPALQDRAGKEEVDAVLELVADREAAPVGLEAADRDARLGAAQVRSGLGDDVDHREESVVAVERRSGAANDLDAVDRGDVHEELRPDRRAAVDVVVHPVAVHQQEHAVDIVARPVEAAHAEVGVVAVRTGVETADASQDLAEGLVTELLDVRAGHDRDG